MKQFGQTAKNIFFFECSS